MAESTVDEKLDDLLEIVNHIKDNAVTRDEFNGLGSKMSGLNNEMRGIKEEVTELKKKVTSISAVMVTKDYLDTKLADLRGDLVVLTRKEDTKLKALVSMLAKKHILTAEDTKEIMSMEPFPQLAL